MNTYRRHLATKRSWLLGWCIAVFSVLPTSASSSEPLIESVSAPVCQRGSETRLKIVGEGFEGCKGLVFYSPKIRCKGFEVDSDYELTVTIQADADCPITNQPFRLLSRFGFSELRTIRVTAFPVVSEDSTGHTVVPNTDGLTFTGILESGDIDRYEVTLKKGKRLSVEVEAVRLGYKLLDTVLKIYDPHGELLQSVDDDPLFQQDPVASIVAAESGTYVVEVNETNYQGSADSHYVLHIGSFPRPSVVFPAGGQLGQQLALDLVDTNGLRQETTVQLPSKMPSEGFLLQPSVPGESSVPTPLPFRLSELDAVCESEPNNKPAEAEALFSCPAAFDGIIDYPGDVDWFRLQIPQSTASSSCVRIEAFADRIGSPIDTMLELFDSEGALVATNDDWGSHDSRIEFLPTADTEYLVAVSDKLGGGKRNSVYRVEVRPVEPKLTAFLPRPDRVTQDSQVISIPQGNRIVKRVGIKREYVDGKVTLQFQDLPPGVFASPMVIPDDQFWVPAILRASPSAAHGGELSRLTAICNNENATSGGFEQTVDLVHSTADQLFNSATVDRLAVAVTPSVPFELAIVPLQTGLAAGGMMQVKVQLTRASDFDEPVRVTLPFLPPWVVSEAFIVISKDETEGVFNLEALPQANNRIWNLVAEAEVDLLSAEGEVTDLEGRKIASELAELQILQNPVSGNFPALAGSPGGQIRALCRLSPSEEFEGSFVATLEGLPARISADTVELTSSDRAIEFAIDLATDAPLGTFDRLQVRLAGESEGQRVSYVVAKQTQLIVQEPEKLMRDSDGRLLSPLETLRKASSGR